MSRTLQQTKDIKVAARKGLPVQHGDLTFYPILVEHYEEFMYCKDALTLRLSSLPVRYMSMDFFSAAFAMEMDSKKDPEQKGIGIFPRLLLILYLSLRIEIEEQDLANTIFYKTNGDEIAIDHITVTQNGRTVEINPFDFSTKIRPIIAELNGLELPKEEENSDLVRAYEEKKELTQNSNNLHIDVADLIASVALHSHIREREVDNWTIMEFENRKRAIDRDKRYMIYAQAEMSGMVKFKNGNPAPSWCFDSLDETLGTKNLSEIGKGISEAEIGAKAPNEKT